MRLTGGHAFLFAAPISLQPSLAETFALTAMQADQFPDVALRIRTHNHPDVIVLTPDGASIKIRQARQLIEQLSNKPFEGRQRAVCILQADTMTQEAQNCLLKTLEEPPFQTMFGLFCEQPGVLLETVRSRCVWLHDSGRTNYNKEDEVTPMASFYKARSLEEAKQCFPDKKDPALVCLTQWMESLSDQLHAQHRIEPFTRCSYAQMADVADDITKAYRMISANVSAKMVAEWLWIQWKEEQK